MNARRLRDWQFGKVSQKLTDRNCQLYAISIGMGRDPLSAVDLPFVGGEPAIVFPTMASVVGWSDSWIYDPGNEINWALAVHGETTMSFHAPMQAGMSISNATRVVDILDKGAGRGALVLLRSQLADIETGHLLCTIDNSVFCRGDGGFGEGRRSLAPVQYAIDRPPDETVDLPTYPSDALIYCLNGDRNPIHWNPKIAHGAGFQRPILHGLCTIGMAAGELFRRYCNGSPAAMRQIGGRFSAPLLPGDTLRIETWREPNAIRFRARSVDEGVVVLENGVFDYQH